jgi:ribonuclease BN (tRNA processing enzyme)
MNNECKFLKINKNHYQLQYFTDSIDIIKTSEGVIRIGSIPEISKLKARYAILDNIVVVPEWSVSQEGDNRTGEEFCFWRSVYFNEPLGLYVGKRNNVEEVYDSLSLTFPYYFDRSMTRILKKGWLNKLFQKAIVEGDGYIKHNGLRIGLFGNEIIIEEKGQLIFKGSQKNTDKNGLISKAISMIPKYEKNAYNIEVVVIGSGNGLVGTASSFVLRLGEDVIWIDPCGHPSISLGNAGVNWNDITHILITHNHEDHISGFSACLKRARDQNQKIRLITAPSVYEILKRQYRFLFDTMEEDIELIPLFPDNILRIGEIVIESRWNHHILPYGTLGLKFKGGGSCVGISGDTKYSKRIVNYLGNEKLKAEWFKDCDIIFHEVSYPSPVTVHTFWKDLQVLGKEIKGEIIVYHTGDSRKLFKTAIEGETYLVRGNRNYEIRNNSMLKLDDIR